MGGGARSGPRPAAGFGRETQATRARRSSRGYQGTASPSQYLATGGSSSPLGSRGCEVAGSALVVIRRRGWAAPRRVYQEDGR
jgi:hypothetical protein